MNNGEKTTDTLISELQELKLLYEALQNNYTKETQKAEEAISKLKESENLLKNFYLHAPVNYQSLDSKACFIDVNPTWLATLGYTREEVIGHSFSEFMTPESAELVKTRFPYFQKAGTIHDFEFDMVCKDGTIISVSFDGNIGLDESGKFKQTHCVWSDISERKKAEIRLQKSERQYRDLIELAVDGILLGSPEGIIISANTCMQTLTGRTPENLIGINVKELFSDNSVSNVPLRYDLLLKGETVFSEREIIRPDGTTIPIEMHTKMMPDGTYQSIYRDISERIQAEKELREAKEKAEASDRLKSNFLNNISHELRTPLNGIIGFSEMITRKDSTEPDREEFSKMIKKSSNRLINTITNYMDISMIASGMTVMNTSTFDLNRFLSKIKDQTIEICNSDSHAITVVLNIPELNSHIRTDEEILSKIFHHLMDNAIKFTKKGTITFGFENKPGYYQFYIQDTGVGISKESLTVIFEVFRQAELKVSRSFEGSGLGLSIALGFVKLLGGELWVESEQNVGSTFYFTIPDEEKNKTISITETNIQHPFHMSEPVILVAEDDDSNFKYIEIVLKKASFTVVRALNGFEIIEICKNNPAISLVLTDMKMPGMDGLEATRHIRQFLPNLPIVGLSAFVSLDDKYAALEAGCNDYIVKPVNKLMLIETINKLL